MFTMAFRIGLANGVMNRGVRGVRGVLVSGVARGEGVTEGDWRWEGGAEIGGVAGATIVGVTGIDTSSPTSSMTLTDLTDTHFFSNSYGLSMSLFIYIYRGASVHVCLRTINKYYDRCNVSYYVACMRMEGACAC